MCILARPAAEMRNYMKTRRREEKFKMEEYGTPKYIPTKTSSVPQTIEFCASGFGFLCFRCFPHASEIFSAFL